MQRIIECVPNISEGRDSSVLAAIAEAIESVDQVKLLHTDRGETAHRTVFTFAGSPESVVEAAYQAIKIASKRIDMRLHKGIHPRMGATDVCPLIPIRGISMAETVMLAHQLGHRVGNMLNIPVYMYEYAATAPHRKNLAEIRSGEYEGFTQKISHPDWKPDYGPQIYQPRQGQTVIGARDFLVAYNVNLNTQNVSIAKRIAADVRESGKVLRKHDKILRDEYGIPIRIPGMCKSVKAIGWYIPEFQCTQVSTNLVNIRESPPHIAYEAIKTAARHYGVKPTGSELIGLIPMVCLTRAGKFYAHNPDLPDREAIHLAVEKLGLSELSPFDPSQRILEYLL